MTAPRAEFEKALLDGIDKENFTELVALYDKVIGERDAAVARYAAIKFENDIAAQATQDWARRNEALRAERDQAIERAEKAEQRVRLLQDDRFYYAKDLIATLRAEVAALKAECVALRVSNDTHKLALVAARAERDAAHYATDKVQEAAGALMAERDALRAACEELAQCPYVPDWRTQLRAALAGTQDATTTEGT